MEHDQIVSVERLDEESIFYVLNYNEVPVNTYLRIADNGCGDYYLLRIDKTRCLERLFLYEHEKRCVRKTEYADAFEYLVKVGLREEMEVIKSE